MSTPKGYSAQEKDDRLKSEFTTVEPVREKQQGMSVLSHEFVREVTTDAAEASSTTSVINATAHSAKKGDVIRFTSGTLSGQEVKVWSTTTNTITLAETLASAPAVGVTFQILRHKYPLVGSDGTIPVTATVSSGPVQFVRDGVDTEVSEDTITPANNRPLPVKLTGITGDITITANDLNVSLSHVNDSVKIGDGTDLALVTAAGELNVLESNSAAIAASLSVIDDWDETDRAKVNIIAGQAGVAAGSGTVSALTQRVVLATDVALPTGTNTLGSVKITDGTDTALVTAAGEQNVLESNSAAIAASLSVIDDWDETDRAKVNPIAGQAGVQGASGVVTALTQRVVLATDVALPAGTNAIGKLSANDGIDIGDVTINNAAGASAVNIQDGGNSITVDGTVSAAQSGNWSTRTQDGAGTAITSKTVGTNVGIHVFPLSNTVSEFVRNDYSSTNVTTAAYTQLIASTSNEYQQVEIFDSSGQTLKLATGAAASEVDRFIITPGGNDRPIRFRIASGTRISIKAISATASTGEIDINFYG